MHPHQPKQHPQVHAHQQQQQPQYHSPMMPGSYNSPQSFTPTNFAPASSAASAPPPQAQHSPMNQPPPPQQQQQPQQQPPQQSQQAPQSVRPVQSSSSGPGPSAAGSSSAQQATSMALVHGQTLRTSFDQFFHGVDAFLTAGETHAGDDAVNAMYQRYMQLEMELDNLSLYLGQTETKLRIEMEEPTITVEQLNAQLSQHQQQHAAGIAAKTVAPLTPTMALFRAQFEMHAKRAAEEPTQPPPPAITPAGTLATPQPSPATSLPHQTPRTPASSQLLTPNLPQTLTPNQQPTPNQPSTHSPLTEATPNSAPLTAGSMGETTSITTAMDL